MVVDLELFIAGFYGFNDEVHPLITHQSSRTSKSSYYVFEKKCIAIFALQFVTRAAYPHRVRYSVVLMMYLPPNLIFSGLIGLMKSIAHLSKSGNVTCGFNGILSL
jgi:hypothetical protein